MSAPRTFPAHPCETNCTLHPSHQLAAAYRLDEIVVGTRRESGDARIFAGTVCG